MLPEIFTKPEFYDVFGVILFPGILILGIYLLRTKKKPEKWMLWALILVGALGTIVDGSLVSGILKTLNIIP